MRCAVVDHFFGCTLKNNLTTRFTSFGAEVDNVVGCFNNIHVVFNDNNRISQIDQTVEYFQQDPDIFKMQAGSWFIEDIHRFSGAFSGEFRSEFHPLCLSARQRGGGLSEGKISESDIFKCFDFLQNGRMMLKKVDGIFNGHIEHIGNGFAFVSDFEGFSVVAFSKAVFT